MYFKRDFLFAQIRPSLRKHRRIIASIAYDIVEYLFDYVLSNYSDDTKVLAKANEYELSVSSRIKILINPVATRGARGRDKREREREQKGISGSDQDYAPSSLYISVGTIRSILDASIRSDFTSIHECPRRKAIATDVQFQTFFSEKLNVAP